MTFLSTGPSLARALAERNYNDSTPVQAAVLADDAAGRDLLVSAQTGSGKTVAYGLAIADNLLEGAEKPGKPRSGRPATSRALAAAAAGKTVSGPTKTRLLRAVNVLLEQKKKSATDLKTLF